MARLEARHLANLRVAEVARALRAVSSAYVERRQTALAGGRVLEGQGKRAAFALYYGPLHFLAASAVLAEIAAKTLASVPVPIVDLGCGTGAVGTAAARATGATAVLGIDTHPWALSEARDTYATFALQGAVMRASADRLTRPRRPSLIVAGYVANELTDEQRARLRDALLDAHAHGSRVLVIEPLARSAAPWWPTWVASLDVAGRRVDEWKLRVDPPPLVTRLGHAAGLTPTQVNLRTLLL